MELKDRLTYLMERRSIANAAELSRMTGLTQVAIRNYMRGIKVPNAQALVKLSRALTTTADYLLTGSPKRPDRIPLLSKIPGGNPVEWSDGEYPAGFGEEFIDRGDITDPNAFALIVDGDSMSPRIKSGDVVIISPNTPVTNRSIAAVSLNEGTRTLKTILFLKNGKVLLKPENEQYEPLLLDENDISIIGRVVERRERL
ncbi:MAG: helix-turn-helix domain-containing protein [Candidatus Latescibacteria bacterium]|nr:helix-turn-helix domain-containing protein [Candidatus Latescibacterota bacterium]